MADAQDLKSWASKMACGFESRLRHHFYKWLIIKYICEDAEEVIQDGTALVARMTNNPEQSGKTVAGLPRAGV